LEQNGDFVELGYAPEHSTATDAEFQNSSNLHDNTLNLPVVEQQPHPDPNYASHAAAHLLAVA